VIAPTDEEAAVPAELLPADTVVGDYVLEALIGSGGFARVYRARHRVLDTRVALKVLTRSLAFDAEAMRRFVREAQAASHIDHPGIVRVLGFGKLEDGRAYQVMELVTGPTLDAYTANRRLPIEDALQLLGGVAEALDAAHAAGIVHRDLKPANILLATTDGRHVPRLTDFGIAKALQAEDNPRLTRTGLTLGTPTYMSPEQAMGGDIGPASDVYAFGVMSFELLSGRVPFDAESPFAIMMKHVQTEAPTLSSVAPQLGSRFDRALHGMLAKDPTQRPASLAIAMHGLMTTPPRRTRRVMTLTFAVTLAVGGALIWRSASSPGAAARASAASPPVLAPSPVVTPDAASIAVVPDAAPSPRAPVVERARSRPAPSRGSAAREGSGSVEPADSFETPPGYQP
jgi:eukaryotic-like serine/threonine-protein kinase